MMLSKKAIQGLVTLSSVALLAACGNNGNGDTLGTTPVEPDSSEEVEVDSTEETEQEETDETVENDSADEETDVETEETTDEETTDTSDDTNTDDSTADEGTTENVNQDSPGIENIDFPISVFDAIEIFNNEFGSPHIDEIVFEREDGRYVYDFEGWDGEYEYEMEIDAQTGEILSREVEADTDQDDILELDGIMTPQEAMAIALEVSGGSYVEEWELEVEDGYTVYDIDIEGGEDQDIDAHTGDVR